MGRDKEYATKFEFGTQNNERHIRERENGVSDKQMRNMDKKNRKQQNQEN